MDCPRCNRSGLSESDFGRDRNRPNGLNFYCKQCIREKSEAIRKANPERERLRVRLWAIRNKEHCKNRSREYYLQKSSGITQEFYDALFQSQRGKCAICETESKKRLAVDHDHKSGKIRGLLCQRCNCAIGLMDESFGLLQSAIEYLAKDLEVAA
jgi:hypothetical protein